MSSKLLNRLLVLPLVLVTCSCGSVEYLNQSKFASENQGSLLLQRQAFANGAIITPDQEARLANRTLGGVSFTRSGLDDSGRPFKPQYFVLRREKQEVRAETILFESKNKNKSVIDNSIFGFGVDRKEKGLSLDLTFRF
jgi:hypothetical protein